jgi:hypothetical protein
MNEVTKMLTQEGGTFNGKHFNSIADLFASLGTKIVFGSSTKNDNYSFYRKLEGKAQMIKRAKNKAERQRKRRGRK